MTKALSSEVIYPEELLTDVLESVSKVRELSANIENNCTATLQKIRESKLEIGMVQVDDDFASLRDPSDRPRNLSDQQRQTIIENGPYQPKLKYYPESPDISTKKQCRFSCGWFKEFPHLEYSVKEDTASCFVCCLFPTGPGREKSSDAWVRGVKGWDKMKSVGKDKKGKLVQHFSSQAHKAALNDLAQFAHSMKHVDVMLNKQLMAAKVQEEENNLRNQEIINILLDIARTLGRQQLAFRGTNVDVDGNFLQIANLVARHNSHLKSWLSDDKMKPYSVKYLSAASQNEFINILAEDVKRRVINEIDSAEMYSVMADTSPDTANTDRLVVAVRYVDKENQPRERVLEMKETTDKSGEGQAKEILQSIESRILNKDELVYQSYDYTASMSGIFKGAQKCLQTLIGRSIPYIPCQGHRSNTFNEHCSKTALFTQMYEVLEELYVFFSRSCKRDAVLRAELKNVENALKLRNLSKTRWVYRSESIEAMWRSFEAIKDALLTLSKMDGIESLVKTKAAALHNKVLQFNFIFAIMFMRLIMKMTKILTMEMQKEELNILDALISIEGTVASLERIRRNESEMNNQVKASVKFAKSFDRDPEEEFRRKRVRRISRRQDDNPDTSASIEFYAHYRKCMIEVLDSLIMEYRDDVKQCLEKIKPLAEVLQPPMKSVKFEQVEEITKLFPPSVPVDSACLAGEFEIFTHVVDKSKEPCKTVHDVCKVAYENKSIFPGIYKAFKLLFTAPVSVAKDERTFSKMKIIKNFLRSTMSDECLEDLIVLATEKDLTDTIDLEAVLEVWAGRKNRKLKIRFKK